MLRRWKRVHPIECVCVCASACARVCVCMHACMRAWVCVHVWQRVEEILGWAFKTLSCMFDKSRQSWPFLLLLALFFNLVFFRLRSEILFEVRRMFFSCLSILLAPLLVYTQTHTNTCRHLTKKYNNSRWASQTLPPTCGWTFTAKGF